MEHGLIDPTYYVPPCFQSEDDEDDPGYRDFPYENSGDAAYCDAYEAHDAHTYRAINSNTYSCPGMDAAGLAALEAEANAPACEHGLSASLCAGPGHYPADR